jgi:hypothetical protein
MGTEASDEIEGQVEQTRRGFVRRMVVGTAFAAPLVASFNLNSLGMGVAHAATNQTSP